MNPFLDSTDVVDDGSELKHRLDREGYLFIRGLLSADVVENLRLQILTAAQEAGWTS